MPTSTPASPNAPVVGGALSKVISVPTRMTPPASSANGCATDWWGLAAR